MNTKLKEALAEIVEYAQSAACHNTDAHVDNYLSQIIAWGKKALNEPLRNCDVGSAQEQVERFSKFCLYRKCSECQFHEDGDFFECVVRWAQMPYESEVLNG
jgi:hypothetical protein